MRIHGTRTLDAPRGAVFDAICDPEVLLAVIPGCREIEKVGDEYRGQIALRLPGVVGTFRTVVRIVETDPPTFGRLAGEVVGRPGSVRGEATFRLAEAGGRTTVDYDGSAELGGPLARLDGRFIEGLAGSLVGQGLGNLETRLREVPQGVGSRGPAAGETPA